MGNCISWDRNKSIWAVRILSEVLLCTGIVACVAAFTIEQGKPHIYLLVIGLVLFLFASIGLASSFCLSHDGKKEKNNPVYTVTLPPTSLPPGSIIHPISTISNTKSKMFASMKSIPVDSEAISAPKHHKSSKQSKYKQSDRLSSINEKTKSMDTTSDEGFNSAGQTTTTNSPDMDRNGKKQRRRKQRRNRTESRAPSQSRTTSSKSSDEYLTRI